MKPATKLILALLVLCGLSLACERPLLSPNPAPPNPTLVIPTPTIPLSPPSVVPGADSVPVLPLEDQSEVSSVAVEIAAGERQLFYGDWDAALVEFQKALRDHSDVEARAAALLGIGRAYFYSGNYVEALRALRSLADLCPSAEGINASSCPAGYFFFGQVYFALQRYGEAAEAYQKYLNVRPGVIDSYVRELRADALMAAGDVSGALADYQTAWQAPRAADLTSLELKLGRAYIANGDYATALVMYQDIYNRSTNDYLKAQMDLLIGQAYIAIGQNEQGYAAYLDAVENYPMAYDSYTALVELVNAGYAVNEFDRGLVDYYAGEYGVAFAAFDRYLQTSGEAEAGGDSEVIAKAHYYRGMILRQRGEYETAIAEWDIIIKDFSQSTVWVDAWEQKAETLWAYMEQYPQGINTYLEFVTTTPQHPLAAQFLYDAARVAERQGDLKRAAQIWERAAEEYPISETAFQAMFLAGITHYRLGDYGAAGANMQRALSLTTDLGERAAALLWIGKAHQAIGNTEVARSTWQQAAAADPTGYYSERARELLAGLQPFTPPQVYDLGYDVTSERSGAELWLKTTFGLPQDVDLSGLGPLAGDERLMRGSELWRLGLYDLANQEFAALRGELASDAAGLYRLANYLIDLGAYRNGILAVRQVLNLNGMDDATTLNAPLYFNRLRFGAYYSDLLIPLAQQYNFHPLFLFSLVRQESLFESFARSEAGARGLMQIIPSTGQHIAKELGWPPNYTSEDLYRPKVSAVFGVSYLAEQRDLFNGSLYAALAAYNGGPGNASIWLSLAPDDPDLFLEVVRFQETRDYIRKIYENYTLYNRVYNRTP